MTTKEKVLALLEQQKGDSVSGERIAAQLNISRAAVWRAVKELKESGYKIEASTRVGYSLALTSDIVSETGIRLYMGEHFSPAIHCYPSLPSTNRLAKQMALEGALHGTVVIADEQTEGRGRNGRSFYSPQSTGIYMSMVLRPHLDAASAMLVTTAVAVAVCRAIDSIHGGPAWIKWVNDIYVDGRKVCGILTEGISGFENGAIESVIVGIGINFSTPIGSFPAELREKAGSLFPLGVPQKVSRNQLIALIIMEVLDSIKHIEKRLFLEEYRQRCMVLGRRVLVIQGNHQYEAVAQQIDENGALLVRAENGELHLLRSGEVTLRVEGQGLTTGK